MFPKCCWMRIASWYCPLFTAPILMNHTQNQSPIAWCTHKTNHPLHESPTKSNNHFMNNPQIQLPISRIATKFNLKNLGSSKSWNRYYVYPFFHFLQCGKLLQMSKHFQKQEANNNFTTELKELSTNNQLNGSMAKFNEQKEKEKETKKIINFFCSTGKTTPQIQNILKRNFKKQHTEDFSYELVKCNKAVKSRYR